MAYLVKINVIGVDPINNALSVVNRDVEWLRHERAHGNLSEVEMAQVNAALERLTKAQNDLRAIWRDLSYHTARTE